MATIDTRTPRLNLPVPVVTNALKDDCPRLVEAFTTIDGAVAGNTDNLREQWRRHLAEAGLNLVDGSFEEGATVNSATDAVWHMAGGKVYLYLGTMPYTVPAESSPLDDLGLVTSDWEECSNRTLREEIGSDSSIFLIKNIEKHLTSIDISTEPGELNSDTLNEIFQKYKGKNVNLFSSVAATYEITSDVTAYGNFDLSNCVFNLNGGRLIYDDERDVSEYQKQVTISSYPMVELTSTLSTEDDLSGWENSLVKIASPDEVDLYRLLSGTYTPKYKGEVNLMTKGGQLVYTLKNTYNNTVNCTLYKLPSRRNCIKLPQFAGTLVTWAADIRRSLVDVYAVYKNTFSSVPVDRNIFSSSNTYGVNWELNCSGIPQPDSNSRYTLTMEYVLHHTFTNSFCGVGWRSIDGSYCRDIKVLKSTLDSVQFHYGSSGVLVENSIIPNGFNVGTGAFDEATKVIDSHIGTFGVRSDYGEHKGDFIIRGGSVRVSEDKSGLVDLFTCRCDNVIASGNPVQPRSLNLPKNVIIATNIYWPEAVTLNIVSFKNNFKTQAGVLRDFVMPSLIDFSGSTFNGKTARFEWALSYHDAATRDITVVKLTPEHSVGCKVTAYVGYIGEYGSCLYGFECNMDITYMNITSGMDRSYIRNTGGVVRKYAGYSGGTTYMQGSVSIDKSAIDWDTSNNFVAGFISVTNSLIDGTRAKGSNSAKPVVNSYVHRSDNNICHEIVATDSRDVVDKKYLLCSREGAAGNFSSGEIPVYY